jgi:hypothetical protein
VRVGADSATRGKRVWQTELDGSELEKVIHTDKFVLFNNHWSPKMVSLTGRWPEEMLTKPRRLGFRAQAYPKG